ncbi:MAG: hypothetical protein JKY81_01415 [Colwellia sp.]|nr:hypothetical protein [Colwellia sp.]
MLIISRIFLSLVLLLISACASSSVEKQIAIAEKKPALISEKAPRLILTKEQSMVKMTQSWQQVTVKYFDLEGGFYGLVSEQGAKLLPMGLPAKYHVNGTLLRVKGQVLNNMVTIQQWGQPFKISDIELIKMGAGKLSQY